MRVLWFCILLLSGLTLPWQFFIGGVLIYGFYYEGLELLLLAFLLDGYVGYDIPWLPFPAIYNLATTGILIFFWGLKPLMLLDVDG